METTDDALGREAFVVLNKGHIYVCLAIAFGVVGLAEPAAIIAKNIWLDDLEAGDFGFDYFHFWLDSRAMNSAAQDKGSG